MKNWMALLTVGAATSLFAVGCSQPENTSNAPDADVAPAEGDVQDMPDPSK